MYNRISTICICYFIAFALNLGCTRSPEQAETPKRRLSEYISKTFSIKGPADKDYLLGYLTGDVRARLQSWSDDQFREAFIDTRRNFLKLSFKDVKLISKDETEITYELSYYDAGRESNGRKFPSKVTNKKLCRMVEINGKWLITEVKNIKELVEFQDELSLP